MILKKNYEEKILEELGVYELSDSEMSIPCFIYEKVFPYLRSEKYDKKLNDVMNLIDFVEKEKREEQEKDEVKLNSNEFKEELDFYSEEDFGFAKHGGGYYAFLDVPAFAIKSFNDGKHYFFDKTEVAVKISKNSDGRIYYSEGLYVTKNNHNPLLHGNLENFYAFCTGINKIPFKGKDLGDVIAQRLRKGKYIFLYSYLKPNLKCDELREKCTNCGKNHFGNHIKPLEEIEKLGVQILEGKQGADLHG